MANYGDFNEVSDSCGHGVIILGWSAVQSKNKIFITPVADALAEKPNWVEQWYPAGERHDDEHLSNNLRISFVNFEFETQIFRFVVFLENLASNPLAESASAVPTLDHESQNWFE